MDRRKLIPSMFHRRLALILAAVTGVLMLMGLQLARLSMLEGPARLEEAESRLQRRSFLPTYRGRILDRKGRILAQDRASYDVAVHYSVISGAWEEDQAQKQARREIGAQEWRKLSPELREMAIETRLPSWRAETERLWQAICRLGGIDRRTLERRLDLIRKQVQRTRADVQDKQLRRAIGKYGPEAEEVFAPQPIREEHPRWSHVVLPRVSTEVAFAFRSLAHDLADEMFVVQDSRRREYPWSSVDVVLDRSTLPEPIQSSETEIITVEGVADHMLGRVRDDVWAEDVERRPFWRKSDHGEPDEPDLGGYLVGDRVGGSGLEMVFEDHLRGLRGEIHERKDTGEQQRVEPVPGKDLQLTIDIQLQARVQAILTPEYGLTRVQQWHSGWSSDGTPKPPTLPLGTPLNSAAVVIEVETGEILAAVSMPTIAVGMARDEKRQAFDQAVFNRPFEMPYPPGSIIKPLVLCAAVSQNMHHLNEPITCTGHYFRDNTKAARCWIYREHYDFRTHGPLLAEEAMARSCNIFFYTLADRMGMARLSSWYRRFGLGSPLNVGLLHQFTDEEKGTFWRGETGGSVPDENEIARIRSAGELRFDSIIMGIGQGPVTWSPVQAANAYATLARGGEIRDATLLVDQSLTGRTRRCADMDLSPELVRAALEGLRQSVAEDYGTGHHIRYADRHAETIFNIAGVTFWGKTGTAQAPPADVDGDGEKSGWEKHLDHAWTVGLAGPEGGGPEYAIAVVVEYGGSGGRVAGPVVNQIINALIAECYLPWTEGDQL